VEEFLKEVNRLGEVRHAHVVQFGKCGMAGRLVYVVTELVPGPSARQFVTERGPLSLRAGVLMMIQGLEGLVHAHSVGFVHGELNPSNLLIGKYDKRRRVKVADLGLAVAFDNARLGGPTLLGESGGSLAFRAPERLTHAREPKPAGDQYSAAATLYYLLTGHPPYDLPAGSGRAVAKVLGEEPVPILKRKADLPAELAATIHKALARDPAARFKDLAAFRQALMDGPGGK
jgi:serine/threonine-protein kinase